MNYLNFVYYSTWYVIFFIDDEEIARISGFCRAAEMDFQSLLDTEM